MKFPSLKNLAQSAANTIKRFPFELTFALAGTIAGTVWIELNKLNRDDENWCLRAIMIANLGFLLTLAASLFIESKGLEGSKRLLIRLVAVAMSLLLFFIINPGIREADYIRFFLLSLSFHLLTAYAGFTNSGRIQGFWQFNKTLFLRFLTGVLYSVVLFLGLAAAIGAMNFLFNFKFEWDAFVILWAWIVGMFSTLFFLSGVPADTNALEADLSYPKGLKVFTQYVLIPLATVYVLILLAYELKIIMLWTLPKGLVSNIILGYAVFGILSLLLVYPIRNKEENKWLKTYARSFYFLLIPLLALLFTAVGTRIFLYGITEMRYFLMLLACWLLFITVYFLVSRKQNIKLIPVSLSILTLLSVYGPQSSFSVSEYSQQRLLVQTFKKLNAFKDGKLLPVDTAKIDKKTAHKAVALLNYLIYKYDLLALQPYFKEDLGKITDSLSLVKQKGASRVSTNYQLKQDKLTWAKKLINMDKFSGYYRDGEDNSYDVKDYVSYTFNADDYVITKIKGCDYIVNVPEIRDTNTYSSNGLSVKVNQKNNVYNLTLNKKVLAFDLNGLVYGLTKADSAAKFTANIDAMDSSYRIPKSKLTFEMQNDQFRVVFLIQRMGISKDDKKWKLNFLTGSFLIKQK